MRRERDISWLRQVYTDSVAGRGLVLRDVGRAAARSGGHDQRLEPAGQPGVDDEIVHAPGSDAIDPIGGPQSIVV